MPVEFNEFSNFSLATCSFCTDRQKKNLERRTDSDVAPFLCVANASLPFQEWRNNHRFSHGAHSCDNETHLPGPNSTALLSSVRLKITVYQDAPARTILAFHERHGRTHTGVKQVAPLSSVSLWNEFLPPIGPRYFL